MSRGKVVTLPIVVCQNCHFIECHVRFTTVPLKTLSVIVTWQIVNTQLLPSKFATWQSCHLAKLSPGKVVTWQSCHLAELSSGKVATWQGCHLAKFSPGNVFNWPIVTCQSCHFKECHIQFTTVPLKTL